MTEKTENYEQKIEEIVREIHYEHRLGEYDSIEIDSDGEISRACYLDGTTHAQNHENIGMVYGGNDDDWVDALEDARKITIDGKWYIAVPDDEYIEVFENMGRLATHGEKCQVNMEDEEKVRVIPEREAYDECDWEDEIREQTQRLVETYEEITEHTA